MYDYEDGNIPDKDVWEYIYNDIEYSYDEGLRDLNVDTEGEIIAIASMGLMCIKKQAITMVLII